VNISELLNVVNNLVPLKYAFEDDYVGITIGSEQDEVKGIVIGHELDKSLLEYCKNKYVNTVISYHPPSFKKVAEDDDTETMLPEMITKEFMDNSINVITLHTAQDVCDGGNADTLVEIFNLKNTKTFAHTFGNFGAGRIGDIEELSNDEFKKLVEYKLNTNSIRTNEYFDKLKEINKIAILPGSGTQFIDEILEKVDVFVTGDISHRYLLKADDANMGLLQVGHITTEIPGMKKFAENINKALNQELEYLYKDFYE
jgi:dinuclear metal center YbgI/SA1388 family protein|tara:strand:- start:3 stop:773 length:771 start_codon:yes stop_codon:yes gene_type:complete